MTHPPIAAHATFLRASCIGGNGSHRSVSPSRVNTSQVAIGLPLRLVSNPYPLIPILVSKSYGVFISLSVSQCSEASGRCCVKRRCFGKVSQDWISAQLK
jgi:hypothetical protein